MTKINKHFDLFHEYHEIFFSDGIEEFSRHDLTQHQKGIDLDQSIEADIYYTNKMKESFSCQKAKLRIKKMGTNKFTPKLVLFLGNYYGSIEILAGSNGQVFFGNCGIMNLDLRVGHESHILIGDKSTVNGAKIVAINSNVIIGRDCMVSDGVLLQAFDQHGIIDLSTREIVNKNSRGYVNLGNHVWLARNSTIMPNVSIGAGSIVGAGSLVTKDVPDFSVTGGNPARVINTGKTWSRSWMEMDRATIDFIEEHPFFKHGE